VLVLNRLQLSITIASVVVRLAVSVLATIATAMIASIAAERRGVHPPGVAQISIARFSNSGPLSLGTLAFTGSSFELPIRLIIALLVLTTFVAQFTSALLVSDLKLTRASSFPRLESNSYTYVPSDLEEVNRFTEIKDTDSWYDYWRQWPRSSETFAKYSEPPAAGERFEDTGATVRAFLPFTLQDERESLLEYRGMARVFDSCVVCMRPKLSDIQLCKVKESTQYSVCGKDQLNNSVDAAAAGME